MKFEMRCSRVMLVFCVMVLGVSKIFFLRIVKIGINFRDIR